MKVTWGLEGATYLANTATTLGSYDGVHLGHRKIIDHLIAIKKERGCSRSLLVTFHPHPQEVLRRNNTTIQLLTTIGERLELLETTGIDETVIIEFNEEFSKTPYERFFRDTLLGKLGTTSMVVGFNHAFGRNREGDIEHLRKLSAHDHIFVDEVPPFFVGDVSISSTKIRHALLDGDVGKASHFLGRHYSLRGKVFSGDGLGRTLGFPTANLDIPDNKLIPKDGVYAARTVVDGTSYPVAMSIGSRPTVVEHGIREVEAHLIGFSGNLYDRLLSVDVIDYLRPQEKFDSLDTLVAAINADVQQVKHIAAM